MNELLPYTTRWMKLTNITLRGKYQAEKNTHCPAPYTYT